MVKTMVVCQLNRKSVTPQIEKIITRKVPVTRERKKSSGLTGWS